MSWCSGIISATLLIASIVYLYIKWCHSYWSRKGVLTPKVSIVFGTAKTIFTRKKTLGDDIADIYKHFKGLGKKYCGYYTIVEPSWIPLEIDLIKNILTKDFAHFTDHGVYANEKNDPLTSQLFILTGTKWKYLRAKLTPPFAAGKMRMMFPTLLDCSHELISIMDETARANDILDIKEIVARYTTDIIGSCAFGIDCNSLKNPQSEFRYYGKLVFEITNSKIIKDFLTVTAPWVLDVFKITIFPRKVIDFFLKIVRETVDYRETNNIVRNDFMHLLIKLKNNEGVKDDDDNAASELYGSGLTMEELTAQAFVFFLGGFETSSTTLTFCLYELVANLNYQDRLRSEICEVCEKYDGKLTYDALTEMKYMEKCINETLRKYPPLPILMRECTEDYKVPDSDLVVEKGTKVIVPILGIQHDPEYYPNPEQFDPERFSHEKKAERHPFAWLPFGEGPRICIGLRFGMMQTKVALSVLLKNYKFSLNEKTATPLVMDPTHFILSTKGGIWLNVEKIS